MFGSRALRKTSKRRDGTMIELTARIKEHLAANPACASQPRFAGLLGDERTSATTTSAASTSNQPQNLPPELPATSSSSQHCHALPPHFIHPSSHTGFSISIPHPASHGLHNPSIYQIAVGTSTYIPSAIFYTALMACI